MQKSLDILVFYFVHTHLRFSLEKNIFRNEALNLSLRIMTLFDFEVRFFLLFTLLKQKKNKHSFSLFQKFYFFFFDFRFPPVEMVSINSTTQKTFRYYLYF